MTLINTFLIICTIVCFIGTLGEKDDIIIKKSMAQGFILSIFGMIVINTVYFLR